MNTYIGNILKFIYPLSTDRSNLLLKTPMCRYATSDCSIGAWYVHRLRFLGCLCTNMYEKAYNDSKNFLKGITTRRIWIRSRSNIKFNEKYLRRRWWWYVDDPAIDSSRGSIRIKAVRSLFTSKLPFFRSCTNILHCKHPSLKSALDIYDCTPRVPEVILLAIFFCFHPLNIVTINLFLLSRNTAYCLWFLEHYF